MGYVLGLAPSGFAAGGDVPAQIESYAAKAESLGVDLLVFPENLMCPRDLTAEELRELAEALDGPFVHDVADSAHRHGLWIVGTMSEINPRGGLPYNTAFVINSAGEVCGSYGKSHLYDAHGVRESDRMSKGDALCEPVHTPFCTLGLGICYDLRFPEVSRALALVGCDLLLYPAAWHDGPHKLEHWQTLLRARAIENECFVAGVCHAGERYVRRSAIYDPLGCELAVGDGDGLVTATIDTDAVVTARDAMPVFRHRRPELYDALVAAWSDTERQQKSPWR